MLQTIIKQNSYQDSVVLMLLTSKLNQLPFVERVSIMMGTPLIKISLLRVVLIHRISRRYRQ